MNPEPFLLDAGLPLGTVYGALLNDSATVQRLTPQFDSPPYKAPPKAPVLYIKPRNTYAADGAVVGIPVPPGEVRVDATIGLVIGRRATRVAPADAMAHVAGYVLVSDITLPHENYYRPAIRQRCRDNFCPMGRLVRPDAAFDLDAAILTVAINGKPVHQRAFSALVRPAARLIADVTAYMTLAEGDVLLLGPGEGSPLARPGDTVEITVPGLGRLGHRVAAEADVLREGAQA
jgi:5-oxopent-3-ene-1,2,5-tricarboxylate decarboxylase/2-hydroxyhepta-2,4-diene-1,7-dioate isomerase